ncbi:MAG TPA: hypothetical protein VFR23_24505 [Jiangellaceae bacterium]|nr:hypothetical protein [Jiangellaceae bacterium]
MTDHAPNCLTNLKIITPGGEEDRLRRLICTCAAKERARIADLEQALERSVARVTDYERALQRERGRVSYLEAENAELRDELERHDGRRREGRQLLRRLVKYIREDRAETKGSTRLFRLTDQVADYLERTNDPNDILRGPAAIDLATADETEKP